MSPRRVVSIVSIRLSNVEPIIYLRVLRLPHLSISETPASLHDIQNFDFGFPGFWEDLDEDRGMSADNAMDLMGVEAKGVEKDRPQRSCRFWMWG
jgi:hypothetical protein